MSALEVVTRFRAYQLGQAGSSFSYFAGGEFTLIEGRLTDESRPSLLQELNLCGKQRIDCLHITSWDQDHCCLAELKEILSTLHPAKIEYPGYTPNTDNAAECLKAILAYKRVQAEKSASVKCVCINPEYISGLNTAEDLGYRDILFGPRAIFDNPNDNSTVKVFREGCFNVASLGDVEDPNIGSRLRRNGVFQREIDVLILAHHGADCATNSKNFLEHVKPKIAICSSNHSNQFDHPRQEVRDRLYELDIPIYTTKTGDVIVTSLAPHSSKFRVHNLKAGSTEISSQRDFDIKKFRLLSMNLDSLRNLYKSKPSFGR